ncbi:glycoside hydrolase family 3 N-terminal domain-containing protein [Paraburkholderia bonniea]|uniref:glycoside hydrolase family 3 protein n=1 Tax=Paraburkholderia bonniea TaxID=2152891 RepID=UPI00129206E5|nr:glycoside hydrolase family 3 protein [Paraburkholderia bonniea]WJF92141.1 glycoside hydrolase family 3 N-terminal domain-containing protein [Paraburkholderia bonniea]WJF95461.1 glycoside hydrolase family 3 N-terminal domain-containing protein [Paraburkholderia bonniea]
MLRHNIPKLLPLTAGLISLALLSGCSSDDSVVSVEEKAEKIVNSMTTREKVGQKIMMAFRYWCAPSQPACTDGLTELPPAVVSAVKQNSIGGVILYADNLVDANQTKQLTSQYKSAVRQDAPVGLLIGVDEEGGNVFRLPRTTATSFPGNMALGAAYEATKDGQLAFNQGRVLATEIAAVGFNVNFAPDVDVNSNPLNPVINVRSYGDDPATVGLLGGLSAQGMASQGVIATFKHFPGHGDTATDSHYGLPIVNKSRADAYAVDLAPYRQAIQSGQIPDMVMTAHIQYPALDNTQIVTRTGEQMIAPATMSRKIQHDILRGELGFRGVTITDALDMQGISSFFEQSDAVLKVFQADVDIALMPVEFRTEADSGRLAALIDRVSAAIDAGQVDRAELDRSVRRIVQMKLLRGITANGPAQPMPDLSVIGSQAHRAIEQDITQKSITLVHNAKGVLPLQAQGTQGKRIFILTPWGEQAEAMRRRFDELGYPLVSGKKLGDTPWPEQKQAIDAADIVIVGTLSSSVTPVERDGDPDAQPPAAKSFAVQPSLAVANGMNGSLVFNVDENPLSRSSLGRSLAAAEPSEAQQMRYAMEYAKAEHKTVLHVSMRAPYDVIAYDDIADAALATYSYYGYEAGLRGPSMPAVVDVMLGIQRPVGKLPVMIWAQNPDGTPGALRYPRGFGLQY